MNKTETVQLFALIASLYPRDDAFRQATSQMVATWHEMLSDIDFQVCKTALKMHTATSQFPPSIAEIRAKAAELQQGEDEGITADEAWAMVAKAIRCSSYFYVREFEKLPEKAQRIVGSPMQLKEWAVSESFNAGVEKALFTKAYNTKAAQDRERMKLPASVRELLIGASPRGLTDGNY